MKILKQWAFVALLGLPLLAPLTSEARGKNHGSKGERSEFHDKILRKLNLTEEQKKKLAEMRKQEKESMRALREKVKAAREKFEQSLNADVSSADLKNVHQNFQTAKTEMANARFEKILKIREILTPEQKKKFKELREKRKHDHKRMGKERNKDDENEDDFLERE